MTPTQIKEFATRYTAAWCSQQATRVAMFFAEDGSLQINDGPASVGRGAITATAQGFMTAFPDMVVSMDDVSADDSDAVYRWTLTGTNSGPGGTGNRVRISGFEEWTFGADGLIAQSLGHFDDADYQRQLGGGRAPNDDTVKEITSVARAIADAIASADTSTLAAVLAPGFVHRSEHGRSDAQAFLAALSAIPYQIVFVRLETIDVDAFGTTAIATGIQHARVMVDGKPVDDRRRFLDLFVRRDERWLLQAAIELGTVND